MIVRPPHNWFRMLFVWYGSVLQSIIPQLALLTFVGVLAVIAHRYNFGPMIPLNTTPFTLCGVALTIFLAFRNNASYDRFWEARRPWGNILISARNLTSQALCYVPDDAPEFDRTEFVRGIIGFVYALKHQLRKTDPAPDLQRYVGAERARALQAKRYRPTALLNEVRHAVSKLQRCGAISDTQVWMFDNQLNELGTMVGGCERIASTPIPYPYGVLLHRTVYSYCLLLPFGLVDSIGIATPLISVFVSYTLIALEAIASDVSEPFGVAPNNLALDAMTRNIERTLLELCDEALPAETKPGRRYQVT
ncbi:Bestrophin, RFP-TM, chloride channel [Caballeronia udeis]|uniref:Bestrophin, RFP-TM, chloride channel n=1 Tax=Caballeronia udeis TaxID=1232866 RepID=A0A158GX76_9BURK|nr:bestrophin family ion channel [Caballeronia udeis]SAL36666.1 Bestrophin, RFP-TM, chloride channel [Caballeronia udeis]